MKLTPIRVRGKRGQPKRCKNASSKGKETPDMEDKPQPKRTKKHHTRTGKGIGGMLSKDWSRLLQLPQEILERIFIASKNLSLPLVNHELRRRLSTDSIKYQLVGAAFGPTWDAWYGLDSYEMHSYEGWSVDLDRIEGDAAFQSAILACSWAKLDMLLTSYDVWIRQHFRKRAYFTIPKLNEERLSKAPEPGSLYDQAYSPIHPESSGTPRSPIMSMRQKLAFDLENCQIFVGDALTAPETNPRLHVRVLLGMHLEIHPGTAIPDDLLSGPFESEDDGSIAIGEEKSRRLFWLVRGGACLQDEQTWEVTRNGFKAILQLVRGPPSGQVSPADDVKRVALATQLFWLFDILGVFVTQWPRYIVETNLGLVTALIPTVPSGSKQESELAMFATSLRNSRRAIDAHGHRGSRWRRRADGPSHPTHRGMQLRVHEMHRQYRADLFLCAQATVGSQASSVATEGQQLGGGSVMGVMHEPWSDFGMD